jgi:histidinol-phosphate aminotransferase
MWQHLQDIERRRIAMPEHVLMRLNRLEKPEPWSSFMQGQIRHAMDTNALQQYPAYPPFYERLARFNDIPSDRLVIGAGIEEFIRNLFMLAGGKVAILWPTCAMFSLYARIFNVPLQHIVTMPDMDWTAADIAAQLDGDVRLLLLANPGQPVDCCFDLDGLRIIAERCREIGATLAVDEAYHGFGAPTALPLIDEFPRVTVLRTFSKAFGAASIRLGYAISSPPVHRELDGVRQSGEVSAASMAVADVLMREVDHVEASIAHTIAGRNQLRDRCREIGLEARGSHANHVLIGFKTPEQRATVGKRLWDSGILTKFDFPAPLDRHMLVTCGSRQLMKDFAASLEAAL